MLVVARMRLRSLGEIQAALFGLTLASWYQIRKGVAPREFWNQQLRYVREPPGRDDWQTWADTVQLGTGDCEDLCIGLTATLWEAGEKRARAFPKPIRPGLIHILVRRADGSIVDPSKALGMGPP